MKSEGTEESPGPFNTSCKLFIFILNNKIKSWGYLCHIWQRDIFLLCKSPYKSTWKIWISSKWTKDMHLRLQRKIAKFTNYLKCKLKHKSQFLCSIGKEQMALKIFQSSWNADTVAHGWVYKGFNHFEDKFATYMKILSGHNIYPRNFISRNLSHRYLYNIIHTRIHWMLITTL